MMRTALALLCATWLAAPARALDDVPFITTPDHVTVAMLELAGVGPRDHVIDLGSGDGRIVITAARRFGASGLGVEIVPDLVARSRVNAAQAGVAARAQFSEQDLFQTDLAPATVVTMYLLPDVNLQLRPTLLGLNPGTRIVSHDWDMGDWRPDETRSVDAPDKRIGREKRSLLHLWVVPARLDGLWCGPQGAALRLTQEFQQVEGSLAAGEGPALALMGRIDGNELRALGLHRRSMTLQFSAGRLGVTAGSGPWAAWRGAAFVRSAASRCG